MTRFLLTLCLAAAILSAQAQSRLHFQSFNWGAMHSISPEEIYIPLHNGDDARVGVLNTTNRGWWIRADTSLRSSVEMMAMETPTKGMAIASNGDLMATQDGWKTATITTGRNAEFIYRHAGGYIAGLYHAGRTRFHWSTDGQTWTIADPDLESRFGFSVSGRFVMTGQLGSFWYSTDGAHTFTNISRNIPPNMGIISSYQLIGADTILVVSSNGLWRSVDLGITYTQHTLVNQPNLPGIRWANARMGAYAFSQPTPGLAFTTDGGATWTVPATVPFNATVGSLLWHGGQWYFEADSKEVFRTANQGSTYESVTPTFQVGPLVDMYDVKFQGNIGISVGQQGETYRSVDGGRYFLHGGKAGTEDLFAVGIAPNGTMYAGDRKGQVWASTDQGQTWANKLQQNIFNSIASRFFFSQNGRILMQRSGQPALSTDNGGTFNFVNGFGGSHVWALKPQSGQMIGAAQEGNGQGPNMEVYSVDVSNGQRTRLTLINDPGLTVAGLHMVDDNTGYLFTSLSNPLEMHIFRTGDGWQSATALPVMPGATGYFTTLGMTIQDFGPNTLAVHEKGRPFYLLTQDGGQTWQSVPLGTRDVPANRTINRPYFFRPDGFIFSMDDLFYLLNSFADGSTPGTPAALRPRAGSQVLALRVVPNPATDRIRFSPAAAGARAVIADMAGRPQMEANAATGALSVSGLRPGLYQLLIVQQWRVVQRGAFVKQ